RTPLYTSDGRLHRDIVLETVGTVTSNIALDSAGHAAQSDLSKISSADLILLAGAYGPNGAHINAADTGAWQTSALLLSLIRDGNDTIIVGNGNNVVIGQGGNNTITAGNGNNLIFGNSALNTTPTQDDLPHIIDAVVIVGAAQGTGLTIPTDGQLVVPSVNLLPSALTPSAPQIQYGLDGYGMLSSIANGDTLARSDGASLAVLASI